MICRWGEGVRVSQVGSLWVSGWEGAPQRAGEISGLLYDRLRIFVSSLVAGDLPLFLMLNLVRSLLTCGALDLQDLESASLSQIFL